MPWTCKEKDDKVNELMSIRRSRTSIEGFESLCRRTGLKIDANLEFLIVANIDFYVLDVDDVIDTCINRITMKRILTILAAIVSLCSCEKVSPSDTFESIITKLYGDYRLTDIHWPGLPVNLNYDDTGYWSMLHEFQNKIGYYEPDYVASVRDAIIFSKEESYAEPAAAFNVSIPYPKFVMSEDKWLCTDIRTIKLTVRATEKTFKLMENSCFIYPGYAEPEDPFLTSIKDISIYVESYDANFFKIGVHCTLPNDKADGTQNLNENYLYYTFER